MEFAKFPKIPRLDRELVEGSFVPGTYDITGKLDGANAGIKRVGDGLLLHSRNNFLALLDRDPDRELVSNAFRGFVQWGRDFLYVFLDQLEEGDHVYGEWLVPHTITYPKDMYNHFYPFNFGIAGVEGVPLIERDMVLDVDNAMSVADEAVAKYQSFCERHGYDSEGVVLRNTVTGDRYKVVRHQFKEEAKVKFGGGPGEPPMWDRMAAMLPTRTYIKAKERVADLHDGTVTVVNTGDVIRETWYDYLDEVLVPAIKELKPKVIDMKKLNSSIANRTREMFHAELNTGQLPAWAETEFYQ